jgi:hypothetical protein
MVIQTTPVNEDAVRFGSAKIEYGATLGSIVDYGAAENVVFQEILKQYTVDSDNAGTIVTGIAGQGAKATFDWLEPDLAKYYTLRGGIDLYTPTTTTPVPVTSEVFTFSTLENDLVRLAHKNGAGTIVASISVKDVTDAITYTLNSDYVVVVDKDGWTCLARPASGSTITDGQIVHANYTYTPYASKTLTTGGKHKMTKGVVRLTNVDEDGKKLRITLYKCFIDAGIVIKYKKDDGTVCNAVPVSITAQLDTTRTVGDQLGEIFDEQGV